MAERISCIVPVYNGERFLAEALDSVLAQTLRPDEIVVVDDGSTDETAAVAARYGDRIAYLRQDNAGPAAARNRGIAASRGELVAFLDADDLWHPEKLARQAARFVARPELEISVTHLRNFWEPELRQEEEALRNNPLTKPALPGYVMQTTVARRTVFTKVGPLDATLRIGEDTDWFLRASDRGAVLEVMPEVLVYRRFHQTNLTRQAKPVRDMLVDAIRRSLERRRQRGSKTGLLAPEQGERSPGKT